MLHLPPLRHRQRVQQQPKRREADQRTLAQAVRQGLLYVQLRHPAKGRSAANTQSGQTPQIETSPPASSSGTAKGHRDGTLREAKS